MIRYGLKVDRVLMSVEHLSCSMIDGPDCNCSNHFHALSPFIKTYSDITMMITS